MRFHVCFCCFAFVLLACFYSPLVSFSTVNFGDDRVSQWQKVGYAWTDPLCSSEAAVLWLLPLCLPFFLLFILLYLMDGTGFFKHPSSKAYKKKIFFFSHTHLEMTCLKPQGTNKRDKSKIPSRIWQLCWASWLTTLPHYLLDKELHTEQTRLLLNGEMHDFQGFYKMTRVSLPAPLPTRLWKMLKRQRTAGSVPDRGTECDLILSNWVLKKIMEC